MASRVTYGFRFQGLATGAALLALLAGLGVPTAASAEELLSDTEPQVSTETQASTESPGLAERQDLDESSPAAATDNSAATDGPAATGGLAAHQAMTTFAVAETRTISGTIHFDERTTEQQRQSVRVQALNIHDNSGPRDGWLLPENIVVNHDTGEYALIDLQPGEYRLDVAMEAANGWQFTPFPHSEIGWAEPGSTKLYQPVIDVTEADHSDLDFYLVPAQGGLGISVQFLGVKADAPNIIATNVANGEQVPFFLTGSAQGDFEGAGLVWVTRIFEAGTQITIHFESNGIVTGYYDGTETGTLSAADALVVTVPLWVGEALAETHLTKLVPTANDLVNANRGDIRVPATATADSDVEVFVGEGRAGELVHGWMFSTPTSLGAARVAANGYATFTLPAGATGDHRIAVTTSAGQMIGWGNISIEQANERSAKELAETGAAISPISLVVAAGLMVAASGSLALAARRKQAVLR